MNTAARRREVQTDRVAPVAFAQAPVAQAFKPEALHNQIETHDGRITTLLQDVPGSAEGHCGTRTRVYLAAESRLLREALARMLTRRGDIDVVGLNSSGSFQPEGLPLENIDILLLTARRSLAEDISAIRRLRSAAPSLRILVVGMSDDETEFFQYVRAGIRGYLPRDASVDDVLAAIRALQSGEAVCPGALCAMLFRLFEREATALPSATVRQRLGLTRREQQIVPLIAQGMTNKEIANQFCLSERTVRNHLYRMMQRTGAPNRLGIVQLCRAQGFVV